MNIDNTSMQIDTEMPLLGDSTRTLDHTNTAMDLDDSVFSTRNKTHGSSSKRKRDDEDTDSVSSRSNKPSYFTGAHGDRSVSPCRCTTVNSTISNKFAKSVTARLEASGLDFNFPLPPRLSDVEDDLLIKYEATTMESRLAQSGITADSLACAFRSPVDGLVLNRRLLDKSTLSELARALRVFHVVHDDLPPRRLSKQAIIDIFSKYMQITIIELLQYYERFTVKRSSDPDRWMQAVDQLDKDLAQKWIQDQAEGLLEEKVVRMLQTQKRGLVADLTRKSQQHVETRKNSAKLNFTIHVVSGPIFIRLNHSRGSFKLTCSLQYLQCYRKCMGVVGISATALESVLLFLVNARYVHVINMNEVLGALHTSSRPIARETKSWNTFPRLMDIEKTEDWYNDDIDESGSAVDIDSGNTQEDNSAFIDALEKWIQHTSQDESQAELTSSMSALSLNLSNWSPADAARQDQSYMMGSSRVRRHSVK